VLSQILQTYKVDFANTHEKSSTILTYVLKRES